MAGRERYTFGQFTLDVSERILTSDGRIVTLAPKTHDLLVALVRNAGRLMTKDALLDRVWPRAHVEEGILNVHISSLRKLLSDDRRRPSYIETVSKSGYRFIAPVTLVRTAERIEVSADVHELIGRGRFHLLSANREELPEAIDAFRTVTDRDPSCAAAHAGLALAHCAEADLRLRRPRDAYADARTAALRALALDDGCADAQMALGVVLFLSDWNWHAAERSFQRALALSPDHSEAYVLYGRLLEAVGRPQEGLEMKLKALQRDPHSPAVHLQIALAYWNQRRFHECIDWANRTLTLDPDHLLAREYLAGAYWAMGDFDRHMTENLRHAESFGMPPEPLERLRGAYRTGGRRGVIDYTLSQLSAADAAPALQLALLHVEAGHLDDAFQYLNRAIDEFDPSLVHLAVAPQWDCLRSDPRFIGCLRRIGFEPTLA